MTNLSFAFNKDEYDHLAFAARPTSPDKAQHALKRAEELLKFKDRYVAAFTRSGIPALWYMVINERESSSNFGTYLGNGQSLHRVTTLVPAGRGPWATWEDGAIDATTYDHVGRPGPEGWTWAWFLYRCEAWNGFGPRLHGRHTGYLWSGSNVYDTEPEGGGKYVADGVWDASAHDPQLGCYPLARAILQLDPSLKLSDAAVFNSDWGGYVANPPKIEVKPKPQEEKLSGISWLQTALNSIQGAGLIVDGSYGRHTRAAVRVFQSLHNLKVDGQAGDATCSAIDAALADVAKSSGVIQKPAPAAPTPLLVPAPATVKKGPAMDFTSIINLAQLVAPAFVPALGAVNPFLPVAINVLGDALGANAPHTAESVSAAASTRPADEIAIAIKTAADMYAKHLSGAAPAATVSAPVVSAPGVAATSPAAPVADTTPFSLSTGGVLMNPWIQTALHAVSGLGGVIIGSGLLDPGGPIAGLVAGRPVLGFAFMILSSAISHYMVKASNDATTQAGIK